MVRQRVRFNGWPGLSPADVYDVEVVSGGASLTIREVDGAPSGVPTALKFPNGTLTDNGDGTYTYTPAAGVGFSDAEGDPAPIGTAADGTSTYAARRDHVHAHGDTGPAFIHLQDQKSAGTSGGTLSSGSDQTRTLNTEVADTGNNCSLSGNQFTLAAGTYELEAFVPAFQTGRHQAILYNVTDSAEVARGSSGYSHPTGPDTSLSVLKKRFTIAAPKAFEIRHRVETTSTTLGGGVACNFDTEIYTDVTIRKVA